MIGPAIYRRLMDTPAVTSLITNRLYPKVIPERVATVYPLLIYAVEDEDRDGTYGGGSGLVSCKVTVACLAKDPASLLTLRNAVMSALDDTEGEWGSVTVQGSFFENENELADRDPTTGEESLYFGSELEFLVWYETGE